MTRFLRLIAVGLLAAFSASCNKEAAVDLNQAPGEHETNEERDVVVQQAFSKAAAPLTDDQVAREAGLVFEQMAKAGRTRDAASWATNIDFLAMVREAESAGALKFKNSKEREAFCRGFGSGFGKSCMRPGSALIWQHSRVMRVEVSKDSRLALVYARHELAEGTILLKARWWMLRGEKGWRVYDWEVLNTGIRISRLIAGMANESSASTPRWVKELSKFSIAQEEMAGEDYGMARATLQGMDVRDALVEFRALRSHFMGVCFICTEKYEDALTHLDEALEFKRDLVEAYYYRGLAYFELNRHEQAVADFRKYVEILGSDPTAYVKLGNCLTWMDRHSEAKTAYLASLQDTPSWEAISGLALCLKDDEFDVLGKHFRTLPDTQTAYLALAADLWDNREMAGALAAINAAYSSIAPDDIELAWYTAELELQDDKLAEAAATLEKALPRVPKERAQEFQEQVWWLMALQGRSIDALKNSGNSAQAFEYLARYELEQNKYAELDVLCEAWRSGHENESMLHFFLGEADFFQASYEAAEKHFEAGHAVATNEGWVRGGLRQGWTHALQMQGRALEAYGKIPPKHETFLQLELLLFEQDDSKALGELIEAHASEFPKAKELDLAKGDLAWLGKDWNAASKLLAKYVNFNEESPAIRERAVRASLRCNAFDAAEHSAVQNDGSADLRLRAIYLIAAGKSFAAEQCLTSYLAGMEAESATAAMGQLYEDDDVGEKLRAKKYSRLHEKYPLPPVKEPEPGPAPEDKKAD